MTTSDYDKGYEAGFQAAMKQMKRKSVKEIFGKNLKRYMLSKNLSCRDVAFELDVVDTSVSSWCCGRTFPKAEQIDKICLFLNINVGDLFSEVEQ